MSAPRRPIKLEGLVRRGEEEPVDPQAEPGKAGEATKTTSVRIPVSKHKRLRAWCVDQDTTIQDFLMTKIDELLKTLDKR